MSPLQRKRRGECMKNARHTCRTALSLVILLTLGCSGFDEVATQSQPLVDGQESSEFRASQEDAIVHIMSERLQCTGTLVAANVVLTGAHCVVLNYSDWAFEGEPLVPVPPDRIRVRIGADSETPRCELAVAEVHTHPWVVSRLDEGLIEYDVAALVLDTSAVERCGGLAPISIDEAGVRVDDEVTISGFGFRDSAWTQIGMRRFAPMVIVDETPVLLVFRDQGEGTPAQGDSGGPLLRRDDEGRLQVVGVMSTFLGSVSTATYLRDVGPFLAATIGPHQECPAESWQVCDGRDVLRCENGLYDAQVCADDAPCTTRGGVSDCAPPLDAGTDAGVSLDAATQDDASMVIMADGAIDAQNGTMPSTGCALVPGQSSPSSHIVFGLLALCAVRWRRRVSVAPRPTGLKAGDPPAGSKAP